MNRRMFLWEPYKRIIAFLSRATFSAAILGQLLLPVDSVADQAQSMIICGVNFRADSVTAVDNSNVEVTVDGASKIVAAGAVEEALMALYFQPGARGSRLGSHIIEKMTAECLSDGKFNHLAIVLPFFFGQSDLDEFSARDLIEKMSAVPAGVEALRAALLTLRDRPPEYAKFQSHPATVVALLFQLGERDPKWTRANFGSLILRNSDVFKSYALDRFARSVEALKEPAIRSIVVTLEELLGDDDPTYRSLHMLSDRVTVAMNINPADSVDALYPLVEASRGDELAARTLYPLVSAKIHQAAALAIEQGEGGRALTMLATLDLTKRTPRTHALVKDALARTPTNDATLLRSVEVELMLSSMSAKDQEIRRAYIALILRQILAALREGDIPRSDAFMARLLQVRPDPSAGNDAIRIETALVYLELGDRGLALDRLSEVRMGISLGDRLRLGMAGLYVNRYLAIFFLVAPLVYVVWFLFVELRRFRADRLAQHSARVSPHASAAASAPFVDEETSVEEGRNAATEAKLFTQTGLQKPTDPRLDEYEQCLAVLALNPKATLKEIKSTYRALVKGIHPDTQKFDEGGVGRGRASNRFIELTQAYDRVLELRRVLGMERE